MIANRITPVGDEIAGPDNPKNSSRAQLIALAGILCLALVMRLVGIVHESFWLDEVLTALFSEGSLKEIFSVNATDIHPPLYYLLLSAWRRVAGDGDLPIRLYSTWWSLGGIVAMYYLVRDIAGRGPALTAAALAAINPFDIYYAQEARMYAQAAALGLISSLLLYRSIQSPQSRRRQNYYFIGYALSVAAIIYTHYVAIMIPLAQGLFVLPLLGRQKRWHELTCFVLCAVAVAVLFAPWMMYVLKFRESIYSHGNLAWIPLSVPQDLIRFIGREFFLGFQPEGEEKSWLLWLAPCLFSIALIVFGLRRTRLCVGTGYLLGLFALPILLVYYLSTAYHQIFYPQRFSLFVLGPFLGLLAIAIHAFSRRWRTSLIVLIGALFLTGTVWQGVTRQKKNWRSIAQRWPSVELPEVCYNVLPDLDGKCAGRYLQHNFPIPSRREIDELQSHVIDWKGRKIAVLWEMGQITAAFPPSQLISRVALALGPAVHYELPLNFVLSIVTIEETTFTMQAGAYTSPPIDLAKDPGFIADRTVSVDFEGDGKKEPVMFGQQVQTFFDGKAEPTNVYLIPERQRPSPIHIVGSDSFVQLPKK